MIDEFGRYIPDRGPCWATGYGIKSYDAERDLVNAWVQLHTDDGTVRFEYGVLGSASSHEEAWRKIAECNGYTWHDGPPLLDE